MSSVGKDIRESIEQTYENYNKLKTLVDLGYFLVDYVYSGGVVTKNITRNNVIDVTAIVASAGKDVSYHDAVQFETSTISTTYYLDYQENGMYSWGTGHALQTYVPVAEVTTNSNGNVDAITDKRPAGVGVVKFSGDVQSSNGNSLNDAETSAGAQAKVDELAGSGRTTETVKGNADAYNALKNATTGLYRNALINSNFDFWQRGTSFTAANTKVYTADRWFVSPGVGTITVTRESFDVGQTAVPGNPKYYIRLDCSSSPTDPKLIQAIEDVRTYAGQTVTVTFWAKASDTIALDNVGFLVQAFGSGGSTQVTKSLGSATLTTTWTKISKTVTVPSISGKTIGDNSNLQVRLDPADNTDLVYDYAQIQINVGNELPYQPRSFAEELALCQRYCVTFSPGINHTVALGYASSATTANLVVHLPTTMRVVPTLIATASEWLLGNGGANVVCTSMTLGVANSNDKTILLICGVESGLTEKQTYRLFADGTANRLLILDGDL